MKFTWWTYRVAIRRAFNREYYFFSQHNGAFTSYDKWHKAMIFTERLRDRKITQKNRKKKMKKQRKRIDGFDMFPLFVAFMLICMGTLFILDSQHQKENETKPKESAVKFFPNAEEWSIFYGR